MKGSKVFQIALKGGENIYFAWERLWPFNAFVKLKTRFSKYWPFEISMTYVYIMYITPDVKKDDTTAKTSAKNKACSGWLDENCYLIDKEWHFL